MLEPLFRAAGVDYRQWRALARAYTQIDYAAIRGVYGHDASMKAARHLIFYATTWTVFGSGAAAAIWILSDAWLSATIAVTTTAMLVAMIVLAQAGLLIAPDDYEIVGFRPITPRTYFAVRATALLLQTAEMAVFTGYLPVVAFLTRSHGSGQQALAAAVAIGGGAIATTLGLTAIYGWLLKLASPSVITRTVTYGAVVMLFGVLALDAAFFMGVVKVGDNGVILRSSVSLPRSVWILWYPGVWFASFVEVARGAAGRLAWTAAAMSAAAVTLVTALLGDRLTAGYATRVAQGLTQSRRIVEDTGGRWAALSGEARAVALITRTQFRDDISFQMSALMMLALPVGLVGVGWFAGLAGDPFVDGASGSILFSSMFVASASVLQAFAVTPTYQASWLFFTTPADRARLVMAMRDIAAVCLMAPLTAAVWLLMWFSYRHSGHALLQAGFVGIAGYINLQLAILFRPFLPFSRPVAVGQRPMLPAGAGFLPSALGVGVFLVAGTFAFRSIASFAITALVLVALSAVLGVWTRRWLPRRVAAIQYFQ